jgi:hypothetical protein
MGKRKKAKRPPLEQISVVGPFITREDAEKFAAAHGIKDPDIVPVPVEKKKGKKK